MIQDHRSDRRRSVSRRQFLKRSGQVAAMSAAAPYLVPGSALGADGAVAPSNRIAFATIGTGNQGTGDMRGSLGDKRVQVVAVCDVNRESSGYWGGGVAGREPARRLVEQRYAADKASGKYKGTVCFYFDTGTPTK